jgi:4a-hydroxytetrahydrobiopterin dehydratase
MSSLLEKKCQACEGGVPPLNQDECIKMLKEIPGWSLTEDRKYLERKFSFKGFYATMGFVNAIAYIVQKEGHHPDLEVGYNYCNVRFTTHATDGLTENDFICAAKINALLAL